MAETRLKACLVTCGRFLRAGRSFHQSPRRLLLIIAVTIFLTHFAAMPLLEHSPLPHWLNWLTESAVLVLLLFPVLHRFAFRPLVARLEESRRAEEQMRESEHKYRLLFESLNEAAFLIDVETGRILDANKQAERMLSRARAEIIGANQRQFHAASYAHEVQRELRSSSEKAEARWFIADALAGDGTSFCVRIDVAPITFYHRKLVLALYSRPERHMVSPHTASEFTDSVSGKEAI